MPNRLQRTERRNSWQLPALHYVIGMGRDEHVDVLKGHLAEASLAHPACQLELVIVQDLEHYTELVSGGVPLARVDDAPDPPADHMIHISRLRAVWIMLGVFVAPGPAALLMWLH